MKTDQCILLPILQIRFYLQLALLNYKTSMLGSNIRFKAVKFIVNNELLRGFKNTQAVPRSRHLRPGLYIDRHKRLISSTEYCCCQCKYLQRHAHLTMPLFKRCWERERDTGKIGACKTHLKYQVNTSLHLIQAKYCHSSNMMQKELMLKTQQCLL